MLQKSVIAVFALVAAANAIAADRSACSGIFCPQANAVDYAGEFAPYVDAGKTWEQVKGRNVLIMKYYNRDGTIAITKTFPQSDYMQPVTSQPGKIAFSGHGTPTIGLYGLSPCGKSGSFDFRGEKFTCASLWQEKLADNLYGTQAILCRAYVDQMGKPVQNATCIREDEGFGTDRKPTGVVIDDMLAGLGIVSLAKDSSGKTLRPDLAGVASKGAAIFKKVTE